MRRLMACLLGLVILFSAGCRSATVYNPAPVTLTSATRGADTVLRDKIVAAGQSRGWTMQPEMPGLIVATYQKGIHQAVVDITYTPGGYSIAYRSSQNLKYDGTRIHPAYNAWVKELETAINSQINPTVAAAAPPPAKTPPPAKPAAARPAPPVASSAAVPPPAELAPVSDSDLRSIRFGRYYALIIGINDYQHLPRLRTAVADAEAVEQLLRSEYDFTTTLLLNPSRDQIIESLDRMISRLTASDNLLIYYAGHGWRDDRSGRGYWLPIDARVDQRSRWLSNAEVADTLKSVKAKHVLVVADSCYAGTLTRAANLGVRDPDYLKRIVNRRARLALTSGGLEPVADKGGGGHSPFANAFVRSLRENQTLIDGTLLFGKIQRLVSADTSQTPEYAEVPEAGHQGGDFVFYRPRPGS